MNKQITPPQYEKPQVEIIELVSSNIMQQTSPGQDPQSTLPLTDNNNIDFDW